MGAECPEPERLAALAEGRLEGRNLDEVVRHLGRCESCYEVLASSVKDLDASGWLPRVEVGNVAPRYPLAWLASAAAALLVVAGLLVWLARAPHPPPTRVARSPAPTPPAEASRGPSPEPGPRSDSAEARAALRVLQPAAPWPPSVGFVPDPRAQSLRAGMADVHRIVGAGDREEVDPLAPEAGAWSDPWRRAGAVLEASRLALGQPSGQRPEFFDSAWTGRELALASALLRQSGVADAGLPDDIRRHGARADAETAQRLLERIGRLFGRVL